MTDKEEHGYHNGARNVILSFFGWGGVGGSSINFIKIWSNFKLKLYRIRGVVLAPPSATDGYEQLSFLLLTMTSNVA